MSLLTCWAVHRAKDLSGVQFVLVVILNLDDEAKVVVGIFDPGSDRIPDVQRLPTFRRLLDHNGIYQSLALCNNKQDTNGRWMTV